MAEELIPVTILTGFLGSGKTTLLKKILSGDHGHKIAVIENEFGEESIDHELLVQDQESRIVEMNNGCICCSVRGDLIDALNDLGRRREKGEIDFERVIIETTGLADPGPVAQTFFMDDEVASRFMLDAVVTLVDAVHAHRQLDQETQAQNQVGFADRLLLTKTDRADGVELHALKHRLLRMNPRAKILEARFGDVDLDQVLDLKGFNLNAVLEIDPAFLENCALGDDPKHVHGPECAHHHEDDHGAHHHHGHHHQDDVHSFIFKSRQAFDPVRLEEFMSAIVQVYGPDLLRYKGVLHMRGTDRRVLFQGVHMLMGTDVGRRWNPDEVRESKMVFIGRKLPRDTIVKGLEQCLVP